MQTEFTIPWHFSELQDHERAVYSTLANKLRDREETNAMHRDAIAKVVELSKLTVARALVKLVNCGYVFECPYADNVFAVRPLTFNEHPTLDNIKKGEWYHMWCSIGGLLYKARASWQTGGNTTEEILVDIFEIEQTERISWQALLYCMDSNLPLVF